MDNGYRTVNPLQDLSQIAIRVEDGVIGTDNPTRAAIDTHRRFNQIGFFWIATNGFGWTALFTRAATGAVLGDDGKWHAVRLPTSASL